MAEFSNNSATNYLPEEIINSSADQRILISRFSELNNRMNGLLAYKNRLKFDVRIMYCKSGLNRRSPNG